MEQGARAYDTPRALAHDADVVLSMLADDAAVEEALLGSEGALDWMGASVAKVIAKWLPLTHV